MEFIVLYCFKWLGSLSRPPPQALSHGLRRSVHPRARAPPRASKRLVSPPHFPTSPAPFHKRCGGVRRPACTACWRAARASPSARRSVCDGLRPVPRVPRTRPPTPYLVSCAASPCSSSVPLDARRSRPPCSLSHSLCPHHRAKASHPSSLPACPRQGTATPG